MRSSIAETGFESKTSYKYRACKEPRQFISECRDRRFSYQFYPPPPTIIELQKTVIRPS